MTRQRKSPLRLDHANVVGIIESPAALRLAGKLTPGIVDVLELRLDAFDSPPDLAGVRLPLIATARCPAEGGKNGLNSRERASRYLATLERADAIDIELGSCREMKSVIEAARRAGKKLILSFHDFEGVPRSLSGLRRKALAAGADVFKAAVTPRTPRELAELLSLLDDPPLPTSAMGMGPLGKASRVAAMACGSVLNYGWIERPNVAGQWSAKELRALSA